MRLDGDAAVEPHDRFILRALSPVETIGGGVVLDVRPGRWHDRAAHLAFLRALQQGDDALACSLLASERGERGVAVADLEAAGVPPGRALEILDELGRRGELETTADLGHATPGAGRHWFAAGTLAGIGALAGAALERRARERPDKPFVSPSELAAQAPALAPETLAAVLHSMVADGTLVEREGSYALAGASAALSDQQEALAARVAERLAAAGFAPPTLAVLHEELGGDRRELVRVLDVLAGRGEVVRAEKELWFAAAAVGEARDRLVEAFARLPEITLADYRDLLGAGRRHAQALLELFDREGLTLRRGDARALRPKR